MDFVEEICVKHGNCGVELEPNHKQVLGYIYNPPFLLLLSIHHPQIASKFPIPTKNVHPILRNQPNVSTIKIKNSRKILKCLKNVYWICRKSLGKTERNGNNFYLFCGKLSDTRSPWK
jgi:hypothetical protein